MRRTERRHRAAASVALVAAAAAVFGAPALGCNAQDFSRSVEDAGDAGPAATDATGDVRASEDAGAPGACPSTDDFTPVAALSQGVTSLGADDTTAFWTDGTPSVWKAPLAGGAPSVFAASDAGTINLIVLRGANTLWSTNARSYWQAKAATAPDFSYPYGASIPSKVALDPNNDVLIGSAGSVGRVAHGGAGSSVFATVDGADFVQAATTTGFYFGVGRDAGANGISLLSCSLATGCGASSGTPLAKVQSPKAGALSTGGEPRILWINTDDSVHAVRISAGVVEDLGKQASALALAADDAFAYVLTTTRIVRIALAGGATTTLTCLSAPPAPFLVTTADSVVLATSGPSFRIVKRAK